nr:hypothetical protein [Tanacetum cinerariifolium]
MGKDLNADARHVFDKAREGVQIVNTKFLNTLPPEWSKFVTDVKLVRDLHTTNVDQLHAYLGQHEYHANEVRLMHERTSDPLSLVAHHQMNKLTYQQHQQSYHQHQFQPQASTYQSSPHGTQYHSSQYAEYAPVVYNQTEFSPPDTGLVVPVFQKGDDPIDAINQMMSFLTLVVYLTNLSSHALQDDLILSVIEQLKTQVVNCTKINQDNKNVNEILTAELERYKNQEIILKEQNNVDKASVSYEQSLEIEKLKHTLSEHLKEKESLEQRAELSAEQAFWSRYSVQSEEPNLSAVEQHCVEKNKFQDKMKIVLKDNERLLEQAISVDIVNIVVHDHVNSAFKTVNELPKVSMVNSCLKKLKFYLASFDIVVKERTTAIDITKGTWGFEHTKACFCDDIIPFVKNLKELFTSFDQCLIDEVTEVQKLFKQMELAVEQHCTEKTKFQTKMENVLNENDRLLTHALSVEIVNIVVHDCMNVNCLNVDACEHCVTTESELKTDFIKKECYEKLLQQYHSLETHCISLEVNNQLNTEIFQRDTMSSSESAPTFAELFEINELKAQ